MKKIDTRVGLLYLILALYLFVSNLFVEVYFAKLYTIIINPLFWTILLIISYSFKIKTKEKVYNKLNKNQTIFIIVIIYLIIYFLLGLLIGYGKNPLYDDLFLFVKNIWYFIIPIIGKEYVRNIALKNIRNNKLFIAIITLLFILIDINIHNFIIKSTTNITLFKNFSSIIIPSITENILLTYLSFTTSYLGALLYKLPQVLLNISLPILPNVDWFYNSLVGLFLPFIIFIFIRKINYKRVERVRTLKKEHSLIKYLSMLLIILIIILFISGFFKYKPIAIISNSMYPKIKRGDVVVIEKNIRNIAKGDVVAYKFNQAIIVHRIYFIEEHNDGTVIYITKGDNNNTVDREKVSSKQIVGIVRFVIPKIGYPSVWLNEYLKL